MNLKLFVSTFCFVSVFLLLDQYASAAEDCECVPFFLCDNETVTFYPPGAKKPKPVINIMYRLRRGTCPNYLQTCCGKSRIKPNSDMNLYQKPCGFRNEGGIDNRITGQLDNKAQFGEFPWMVAIFRHDWQLHNYRYKCGGSLIHPRVVLTATHCVSDSRAYKVRVGEWDRQRTNEIGKHQDVKVEEIVSHSNFDSQNLYNDVSLLFLETEVFLAYHVNVACLPPQGYVASGGGCFVTGWGKNKFEKGVYQTVMKKIEVPVMDRGPCQKAFTTAFRQEFDLHRSFMCAGGKRGEDACTGDGGGPLVCPISGKKDRYQQVGIVAWGRGCGQEGVPGAYVDVAIFRNWIDDKLKQRNLNSTIYRY